MRSPLQDYCKVRRPLSLFQQSEGADKNSLDFIVTRPSPLLVVCPACKTAIISPYGHHCAGCGRTFATFVSGGHPDPHAF